MPTKLPPRRTAGSSEESHDDGEAVIIPAIIIVMLLMANLALYCDRYGMPTAHTPVASSAELQLSP